ncbi:MAG TPA: hypothetical protein VE782_14275 [Myxococcaceae bacterium]|jgi:hypothetical protein|nr:hypothetical protein [Myxococcaceae bacterium]
MTLMLRKEPTIIANVRVGKADVDTDKPTHVSGVRQGNAKGNTRRSKGFTATDRTAVARAARSTGINPKDREPIDPRMPKLSPS